MRSPLAHPDNEGVLRYLADDADPADPASVSLERPTAATDTWRLGAHPDVVERLWTHMNAAFPVDARHLIGGSAALVHPESGVILAVALGTQYALRLSGRGLAEAERLGYETSHTFRTVGRTLDLAATFGSGWVFGRHGAEESEWMAESYLAANL